MLENGTAKRNRASRYLAVRIKANKSVRKPIRGPTMTAMANRGASEGSGT